MSVPFSENGGFLATTFFLFVPAVRFDTGDPYIGIFDTTDFDDPNAASSYSWRAEDIAVARVPTVRRVILVYTDLGVAKITVTLSGTNDLNNVISASQTVTIGTSGASGAQLTAFVDVALTAFRPQLTISRAAGGGPLSIVSATLTGEVEKSTL